MSFRAGRISITVDSTTGTTVQLGWYNSLQDAFGTGSAVALSEGDITFGAINFNGGSSVPEPGTTLLMGLGMLGLVLAGRSSRK